MSPRAPGDLSGMLGKLPLLHGNSLNVGILRKSLAVIHLIYLYLSSLFYALLVFFLHLLSLTQDRIPYPSQRFAPDGPRLWKLSELGMEIQGAHI